MVEQLGICTLPATGMAHSPKSRILGMMVKGTSCVHESLDFDMSYPPDFVFVRYDANMRSLSPVSDAP